MNDNEVCVLVLVLVLVVMVMLVLVPVLMMMGTLTYAFDWVCDRALGCVVEWDAGFGEVAMP